MTVVLFSCSEDEGVPKQETLEKSQKNFEKSIISFQEMKSKVSGHSFDNIKAGMIISKRLIVPI